jgi:hypothetical protein
VTLRAAYFSSPDLLLRIDAGVIGTAEEHLSAPAVAATGSLASAAAPVRIGEQSAVVPARHLARWALAQRVDAEREEVPARDYGNEK